MNKLNNLANNLTKNLTILSASKFVTGILAVANNMVPACLYPRNPAILAQGRKVRSIRDGDPSYKQDRKGGFRCSDVIPANRLNRKTRRNMVRKVSANKPQVINVAVA